MAKTLLTILFLCGWLPVAEMAQLSFSSRFGGIFLFWTALAAVLPALFYLWISAKPAAVSSPHERWLQDERLREKVRDIEIDYKRKPKELKRRTVLLALLGYGVVWGGIVLLAALGIGLALAVSVLTRAGAASALVAVIPLAFAFKLAKSLLSPRGGDAGVRLYRKDAPVLFRLMDTIRRKGKGPPFVRVFITAELNASVSRHTGLLGFFGFGPVTLTLGLPLMQSLSEAQLAAVIGHEYGHVAARDNALGQWIYRIRSGWLYLGERLKTENLWYMLRLDRFYCWFIGVFNAYSFTLSRRCEYEADAFAAKLAGAQNIASALVVMEVQGRRLQKDFWTDIWKKCEQMPDPVGAPYRKIGGFLKEMPDATESLDEIKKSETGTGSTHPAVSDRLRALGKNIAMPKPLEVSAASGILGEKLEMQLVALFDRAWRDNSRKAWKRRHHEHQAAAQTLHALGERRMEGLSRDELSQLVSSAYALQDDRKVMAACREIIRREPENAGAKIYLLGLRLTHDNDESALLKLDELVVSYPEHVPTACRFAIRYFEKQGRHGEARVYQFRLDEWNYQHQAAEEERRNIFAGDILLPHGITPEYVRKLAAHFKKHKIVGMAYLARKQVDYNKKEPLFVIGLKARRRIFASRKTVLREMKQVQLPPEFPPLFRIFWVENVRGLESRMKKVTGSRIYKG